MRSTYRLSRHWVVLATGLGAAVPVLVATIRALADGWMPVGDQGIIATRAYDVLTSHTPLLGQYSEASIVSGQATYSPGPLLYWLLALPARLGAPASLTLTVAAVNVASIAGVVAVARRRGGCGLMVATAVALALMCRSFSSESLHDIFNPSVALLPFTLLVFLCWSLACGEHRVLPLVALVASFVAQCHVAFVAPSVGLIAVGAGGLLLGRRRQAAPPSLRRWALAAGAVGLVCWSAPLVDQIAHRPGNISALVTAASSGRPTQGRRPAMRALVRAIGLPPRWLRAPRAAAGGIGAFGGGDYGDTRISDVATAPTRANEIVSGLVLLALVAAAAVAPRRGRGELAGAALIALVLCAALAANVAATPLIATNTLGYMLWWGSVAGMWVWLVLGWSAASAVLARIGGGLVRPAPVPASVLGAAVAVAAGAAVASSERRDTHAPYYRPTAALAARLDRAIPRGRGRTLLLSARGIAVVPVSPAIRYELRRRGLRVLGSRAWVRLGSWYRLDHRPFDAAVGLSAGRALPFSSARLVASVTVMTAAGPRRITATLSPGRSPRRPVRPRSPARPTPRAKRGGRRRP